MSFLKKRNVILFLLSDIICNIISMSLGYSTYTALFIEAGISDSMMSYSTSIAQACSVAALFIGILFANKVKKVKEVYGFSMLFTILRLAILPIILYLNIPTEAKIAFYVISAIIGVFVDSVRYMFIYKLPMMFMNQTQYDTYLPFSTFLCGAISLLLSIILSALMNVINVNALTIILLSMGAVAVPLYCILILFIKIDTPVEIKRGEMPSSPETKSDDINEEQVLEENKNEPQEHAAVIPLEKQVVIHVKKKEKDHHVKMTIKNTFKNIFYPLAIFDFCFGFSQAFLSCGLIVALRFGLKDPQLQSLFSVMGYTALFLSALILFFLPKRNQHIKILITVIIECAAFGIMFICGAYQNWICYIICYAFVYFGIYCQGMIIPSIWMPRIKKADIPCYSSSRQLLMTLTGMVSGIIGGLVRSMAPADTLSNEQMIIFLTIGIGAALIYAIGYFVYYKKVPVIKDDKDIKRDK